MASISVVGLVAVAIIGMVTASNIQPSFASFPGTNGKIAFSAGGKVFAMNPDGTNVVQLTNGTFGFSQSPKWSHDGTKIAFDEGTPGGKRDIFVLNLVNGHTTDLTSDDDTDHLYPSWSNDSSKIVFDRNAQVYTMNADGTNMALVSSISPSTTFPNSSPDGSKMAFINGGTVAVMNADGTGVRNIPGTSLESMYPNWSPDGSKIAFTSGDVALYIVNSDGTGLTRLLDNAYHPSWSPDGTKLTFARQDSTTSQWHIYVINADGLGLVNLGIAGINPDWGVSSSVTLPPPSNDAPVVTGTVDRPPDMNGYYNHAIVITWTGADSDGIASCDPQIEYSDPDSPPAADGVDNSLTFTGHCIDKLGNEGTGSVKVRYDNSKPEISSPQQGKSFFVGQDVATAFSCADASSGIQTCIASTAKLDTSSAGAHSYLVTATDVAGNTEQLTVNYTVFSQATYTLTINAAASGDNSQLHMWTVIRTNQGTIVQSGFTPLTFTGNAGSSYFVTVSDYQSIKFLNWEGGSTSRGRTFTLASDVNATTFFDASSILRGYTSLTYVGTPEQPDLTVNAIAISDGRTLHMWTAIQAGPSTGSGTTYTVTVQDYLDRKFDHWDDGSTNRTRTLTISEAATITAFYQTG